MRKISHLAIGLMFSCNAFAILVPGYVSSNQPIDIQISQLKQTIVWQQQALQNQINALVQSKLRLAQLEQQAQSQQQQNNSISWLKPQQLNDKQLALNAGTTDKSVHICQASLYGNLYPGELTSNGCQLTYAGRAILVTDYKVLSINLPIQWLNNQQVPDANNAFSSSLSLQPILGGYENGHGVAICRVSIDNALHIGKVVSGNCNIAWQNKEASWPSYDVLCAETTNFTQPVIPLEPGPVIFNQSSV
jgi:hypothetical protein